MLNVFIFSKDSKVKKTFKLNQFKIIIYLYICLIKISFSYSECERDFPFKKGASCISSCNETELSSGDCIIDNLIIKTQWLNNIFLFDSKNYRAGHFAFNSNGDMIIEYSYREYRLFFGLKKNGKFFFKNENENEILTKEVELVGTNLNRYESKNIFISTPNSDKEYLFSIGVDSTIVELHDLETGNYTICSTNDFLGKTIYSYIFSLMELTIDDYKEYLIAHIYQTKNYILQKFSFSGFNLNSISKNDSESISIGFDNRIVSSFIMESLSIIVLFYINNNKCYTLNIYDFNLNKLKDNVVISENINPFNEGIGIFSKGLYIKDRLAFFIYYKNTNANSLHLKIGNINSDYSFTNKLEKDIERYSFSTSVLFNDLVKVNDERFAFLAVSDNDYTIFYILLFDFYNEYNNLKIRIYKSKLYKNKLNKELVLDIYNGYLVFTSTIIKSDITIPEGANFDQYRYSIFIIFGYVNGTDFMIDISEYFMDDDISNENNIFIKLTENITIDNNIFGYEVINDKIKLISIPNEIIFYNKSNINNKLLNGDILDKNYKFVQNVNLIKTDKYYSLDYQIIIKEPDFDTFNSYAIKIIDIPSIDPSLNGDYFLPKHFYGRSNTVKFKLCHKYCASCKKIGNSINDQKCETCLENYKYDYPTISPPNCVPEGYYKKSENEIEECTRENSKFYIDLETNKNICFKKDLLCPTDYPFLIYSTNECKDSCSYTELFNKDCSFSQINDVIYKELKEDVINTYPNNGDNLVIEGEDEYVFQLTTSLNEINSLEGIKANGYNLSMIDISNCENLLRQENGIDGNTPLIILKFEKLTNVASEKNVQYEIFNPNNKSKLDLSICKSTSIDLYIPIQLSEKTQNLYEDLQESGYNLFNINDSFYQDICSTYKSENNTDVLLTDRKNDFYSINETMCQSNCKYSDYSVESKYLKCECSITNENIDTNNLDKFNAKIILTSFYDVLKYSNVKVLKCFKLVFNINSITKNIGSIIVIILFLFYFICFLIFIIKGISSIKIETVKTIFELKKCKENKDNHNNKFNINNNKTLVNNNKKEINDIKYKKNLNNKKIINIKNNKNEKFNNKHKKLNCPKKRKNISSKTCDTKNNSINLNIKNPKKIQHKRKIDNNSFMTNKKNNMNSKRRLFETSKLSKNDIEIIPNNSFKDKTTNDKEQLDNFELNELDYLEAIKLDKRSFGQIYWSLLMREHKILFTFFSWNDYNIIYIKLAKFIFLICTDMAMNVFFFFDESMHKIYLNYGKYDFIQQIPQILYSTIISQLIEVFLCYLTNTDKYIYHIKNIKKQELDKADIFKILKCIKIKLIIFFAFTFIFFLFYWYLISTFCAVYENTQITFIKDSGISFFTSLIYPFPLYLFPTFLRIISIKDTKKKRFKFLYKLSDIIPIF